jgi:hypothetical protein
MRGLQLDAAMILTSFHQSALPLALLLRLAGVPWIGAISDDYPGSLLDVRHRLPDDLPEAERALSLAEACGFRLAPGDAGRLAVAWTRPSGPTGSTETPTSSCTRAPRSRRGRGRPTAAASSSAPGLPRTPRPGHGRAGRARALRPRGRRRGRGLGRATSLAGLGHVLAGARVVVVGNTGPAHLAAAVGTPVPPSSRRRCPPCGGRPTACRTPSCTSTSRAPAAGRGRVPSRATRASRGWPRRTWRPPPSGSRASPSRRPSRLRGGRIGVERSRARGPRRLRRDRRRSARRGPRAPR